MIVADVRVRILGAAVEDDIAMSFGALPRRSMALVEIETEDGLVGRGESWINFPPWAGHERRATIEEGVAPLLVGEDARDIGALHARMVGALGPLGRQWGAPGPMMQAISGADLALWDLAGTAAGVPVAELLGGRVRERVPVYASGVGPTGVAELVERCARRGFGAVKLRLGFGRELDEANVRAAREAGPGIELLADANQAWTLEEALAIAPVLRECAVRWVEEPVVGDDPAELAAFHRRTGLAVATGENLYGRAAFEPYLARPEIAVLQPDVSKAGGLTEALAVCRRAGTAGRAVAPHLYGGAVAYAATLQLAASSPAVRIVEYDVRANPLRDGLMIDPPRVVDGHVTIPAGPGLGVTLDAAALEDLSSRGAPA
ncbi:MAG: mandelate racemase/muconate lactonizing enzyme family protein [Solirubrobacteraceae bacterium]